MNKKYSFLFLLVFVLGVSIYLNYQLYVIPKNIINKSSIKYESISKDEQKLLKNIYKVNFELEKYPMGTINLYVPKYKFLDLDMAKYYFNLFMIKDNILETEDYYYSQNDEGIVFVYKYDNLIKFTSKNENSNKSYNIITDEDALKKAVNFIEEKLLFLSYEETEVNFDGEKFIVTFINRVGNIKNYSFNTVVILNKYGDIISMDYSNMTYENFDRCKIKSMQEAFYELPIDFPEETNIILEKCNIVYIYDNSFVQPAYLFEGRMADDISFQCFVKAAVYDE